VREEREEAAMARRQVLLAVDVGSTKAAALVAEARGDGDVAVLGIAATPVMGVRRGYVVEAERAAQSVRDAVNRAVSMAGIEPADVVAAVNGDHVRSDALNPSVDLRGRAVQVTDLEVLASRAARSHHEPGREAIRVVQGRYELDGLPSQGSPVGLAVHQLTVEALVVSGQVQPLRNVRRTLQMAGLSRVHLIPAGLAASVATLSEDERQLGVVLLDVGGGTTQVVVWRNGSLIHLAVIPVGSDLITSDLAMGLGIVTAQAERIKLERGFRGLQEDEGLIEVRPVSGQAAKLVPVNQVADIVSARLDEWRQLVEATLAQITWTKGPAAGVVLVGGGSQMKGLDAEIGQAWRWPVRIGVPQGLAGLSDLARSPGHATVVGLAKLGLEEGLGSRRETFWSRVAQGWFRTWS
jgi:cell division protein FtsA